MNKIRIELSSLASTHQSGVAGYTQLLAEALAKDNDTTVYGHYFNFLKRQPPVQLKSRHLQHEQNTLFPLRVYAKLQSHRLAPAFDTLLPRVDLTIFPNFATWPTVKSRLSATVIHDLTYLHFPELMEKNNLPHLQRVVPRSIQNADIIITVSESTKKEIVETFGIDKDSCIVTPIPPSDAFFSKAPADLLRRTRRKYGIDEHKKYIYFIGNIEPRKNIATLVKAYTRLSQQERDTYQLVIAGGIGWKAETTMASIQNAAAAGYDVIHIGRVDQKDSPALLQGAALFATATLYEGFGMPVLEAMASGTPSVISDIPVLREVGRAASHYANPRSAPSFTRAISSALAAQRPARATLQKEARRYSWHDNTALIIKTIHRLSDTHRS